MLSLSSPSNRTRHLWVLLQTPFPYGYLIVCSLCVLHKAISARRKLVAFYLPSSCKKQLVSQIINFCGDCVGHVNSSNLSINSGGRSHSCPSSVNSSWLLLFFFSNCNAWAFTLTAKALSVASSVRMHPKNTFAHFGTK